MHTYSDCFLKLNNVINPKQIWICFHYLGGSASAYFPWKMKIPENIQLYAMQLPGRDARRNEPLLCEFQQIIDIYFNELLALDLKCPFIFYGHSMGALIAYELMAKLEQLPYLESHFLIVSACKAPHYMEACQRHDFSDNYLIEQLSLYGGTPSVILEDKLLLESFLPRLRADTEVLESYRCHQLVKLACPIYAFGGNEDACVSEEQIAFWADCTKSDVHLKMFSGGHFFVNKVFSEFIQEIIQISARL